MSTTNEHDALEQGLAALTEPMAGTSAWKAALDAEAARAASSRLGRTKSAFRHVISRPRRQWGAAAAVLLLAGSVAVMWPAIRSEPPVPNVAMRDSAPVPASQAIGTDFAGDVFAEVPKLSGIPVPERLFRKRERENGVDSRQGDPSVGGLVPVAPDYSDAPVFDLSAALNRPPDFESAGLPSGDRAVISKCWIDLESADVYATFSKAMLLVSEAHGEYVEGTAITGEGAARRATMTLRVTAARQAAVLQGLRDLAKVKAEQSNNEDVTAQVVDLEARIANERRTEAELLALFDTRKDAPLSEIMQLRDSIARVRDSVERLVAQQQRLSRLVALTTVTVNIAAPQEAAPPPEPKKSSLGEFFFRRMDESWTRSLEALVEAAAFIVRLVIGGLPFWIAAGLLALGARAVWRRTEARAALEPAPVLKGV